MSKSSRPTLAAGIDVKRELHLLEDRFNGAAKCYEALRESAHSAVKSWVWSNGPRYKLDPLFFLDVHISRGEISNASPADPRGWTVYGFSAAGHIAVEREYLTDLRGRHYNTFYSEIEDRTLSFRFHHDPALGCIGCAQLIFNKDIPGVFQRWGSMGYASSSYTVADGRIRAAAVIFKGRNDDSLQRLSRELRYLDDGRVEVWEKEPGARAQRTFLGPMPADNPFLRR